MTTLCIKGDTYPNFGRLRESALFAGYSDDLGSTAKLAPFMQQ